MPDAMEKIFDSALAFGRCGGVSIFFSSFLGIWIMIHIPTFGCSYYLTELGGKAMQDKVLCICIVFVLVELGG